MSSAPIAPTLPVLRRQRRLGAGQVGRLVFAEHRAEDVRLHLVEGAAVDLQELHVRVGAADLGQHVVELEADGDDDLGAGLGRRLEVLPLRRRVGAFIGLRDAAELLGHALGPDLAELQEVVHADRIGRDVDDERLLVGEARPGEEGERKGERCDSFHGHASWWGEAEDG